MKIWNVNMFTFSQGSTHSEDLGTFGNKADAIACAHEEMGPEHWDIAYLTENEIHFTNGPHTVVVESIHTG